MDDEATASQPTGLLSLIALYIGLPLFNSPLCDRKRDHAAMAAIVIEPHVSENYGDGPWHDECFNQVIVRVSSTLSI